MLKGELSLAEAARRHGVSSATVGNWRDRFVDAGKAGMDRSLASVPSDSPTIYQHATSATDRVFADKLNDRIRRERNDDDDIDGGPPGALESVS